MPANHYSCLAKGDESNLSVMKFLSRVGFLWMIEPFDTDHHVVSPGLPHALDVSNEGEVWSSSRQEHGTVSNTDRFLPTHYGFVEKLLRLPFHSPPLSEVEGKAKGYFFGHFYVLLLKTNRFLSICYMKVTLKQSWTRYTMSLLNIRFLLF